MQLQNEKVAGSNPSTITVHSYRYTRVALAVVVVFLDKFRLTIKCVSFQLKGGAGETAVKPEVLEELKEAFFLAEEAYPGISDVMVTQLIQRLQRYGLRCLMQIFKGNPNLKIGLLMSPSCMTLSSVEHKR